MTTEEKQECLENLQYLGATDAWLAHSAGKAGIVEEFSFEKPCYGAFPVILYYLFKHLDENECNRRFKGCWPLVSKSNRTEFRQASLLWLQDIRKTQPPGVVPDVSCFQYDNPFGERFVRFLLAFSTFVLRMVCFRREAAFSSLVGGCGSATSVGGHLRDLSVLPTEEDLQELSGIEARESETIISRLTEIDNQIEIAERELLDLEEEERKHVLQLKEKLVQLSEQLDISQSQHAIELNEAELPQFAKEITDNAKSKLLEYENNFNNFKPLFEQCKEFGQVYQLVFCDRPVFEGVNPGDSTTSSGVFKDIFVDDGRLDVSRLVERLKLSISNMLDLAQEAGEDAQKLARIQEESQKDCTILAMFLQEQNQWTEWLKSLISEIGGSIAILEQRIAQMRVSCPAPPRPDWLRPAPAYTFASRSFTEFSSLNIERKIDWHKICAFDDSICSEGNEMTNATIENRTLESEKLQNATRCSATESFRPESSASNIEPPPRFEEMGPVDTPSQATAPKPAAPTKFRLSISSSPFSSSYSFGRTSLLNMTRACGDVGNSRQSGGSGASWNADGQNSFSMGSFDSPIFEARTKPRRFSMRLQGAMLEILKDEDDEDAKSDEGLQQP